MCGNTKGKLCVVNAEGKETVSPTDSYTVCSKCLKEHYGKRVLPFKKKRYFTHPTFMGIMRKILIQRLRAELTVPVEETLGAVTKQTREHYGLEKTHIVDARCISQHPIRKINQLPTYMFGYRLFDKVRYLGQECFVWGRRTTGSFLLKTLTGDVISQGVTYKKLQLLERGKNLLIERKTAFPPTTKVVGFQV